MAYIDQIILMSADGQSSVTKDIAAKAENIFFQDTTNLEARFVDFTGADGSTAGAQGLVPAPAAGDNVKFLQGDGTWGTPAGGVTSVNNKTGAVTLDASDVGAIDSTLKGAASGVAELDANGKVPSAQLPSYVDDVIEAADYASLPATGEAGKIYITLDDNKTYRWGGSAYVEISESLALGETSTTAYRGDRGKTAYDHATDASRHTTAETSGLYKIATTAEGHVASVAAVEKADITGLGIPAQDTTYTANTTSIGSASGWITNTPASFSFSNNALVIQPGAAASLTVTSTTVATGITAN